MIDKLEIHNSNLTQVLKQGRKLALALSISLALSGCSLGETKKDTNANEKMTAMMTELEKSKLFSVTVDELNELNIILCNNQCNASFFDATVEKLEKLGVKIQTALPGDDILSSENATIVTMAGLIYDSDSSVILGQYNNELKNNSDILALAMNAGLRNKDIAVDGIRAGVSHIDKEADITTRVPTATELHLDTTSSFVVVAIGTHVPLSEAEIMSDGIVNGLIRGAYEIKRNPQEDYLHRISATDTLNGLAIEMNMHPQDLKNANENLTSDFIPRNEIIIRPGVKNIDSFRKDLDFDIERTHNITK